MTPMSITSTSVKKRKVRVRMLLLPRSLISPQCAPSALQPKTASQQMNSYWLAKRLSVSCKIPLQKQWTTKRKMQTRMERQMFFHSMKNLVLISTVNLPRQIVTNVGSNKLLPKFIGPFRVLRRLGNAYTIELPRKMHASYVLRRSP